MKTIREIMNQYTSGAATLEETNFALQQVGAAFHLNPQKNELTDQEIEEGFGLLDTGTGSLDKVQVKDGCLVNCDCGEMEALVLLGGKYYAVRGKCVEELEDNEWSC